MAKQDVIFLARNDFLSSFQQILLIAALKLDVCHEEWHFSISFPLVEKTEYSAWSEDVHSQCKQLSVLVGEKTVCALSHSPRRGGRGGREREEEKKAILSIMVSIRLLVNLRCHCWGFSYFILSLFLISVCLHQTLKNLVCFILAEGPALDKLRCFFRKCHRKCHTNLEERH